MKAQLYSIGKSDLIKGAIMAALAILATGATEMINGLIAVPPIYPSLSTVWHLLLSGGTTFAIYILKNFLTNSDDQFLKKEVTQPNI